MLSAEASNITDDQIKDYLEEIEGDNYTFLHVSSLLEFEKLNLIGSELINPIVLLRQSVESVPMNLWNINGFKQSREWAEIHKNASSILKKLK